MPPVRSHERCRTEQMRAMRRRSARSSNARSCGRSESSRCPCSSWRTRSPRKAPSLTASEQASRSSLPQREESEFPRRATFALQERDEARTRGASCGYAVPPLQTKPHFKSRSWIPSRIGSLLIPTFYLRLLSVHPISTRAQRTPVNATPSVNVRASVSAC